MDSYKLRQCRKLIERELSINALSTFDVVSVSVVSKDAVEFAVKKIEIGGTEFAFTEEEIYEANGTSLWGFLEEKKRICTAKAILDLNTMKPLGYINIVYENSYFSDIVEDNSTEYSGASYIVDQDGRIVITNQPKYLGTIFPMDIEKLKKSDESRYDKMSSTQVFYYVGNQMPNNWTLIQTVSVREFYKNLNQLLWITIFVVLMVLGVSFIFVWGATSRISKPTRALLDSMKALGKSDRYPRVKVTSRDEIGMIGTEYNKMAENIETLIEKVYKMEIAKKQAELEFLQMQINPHFLYNALDTISWTALGEGSTDVSELTIALADLLRASIKKQTFIPLEEEIKTVRDYLFIQSARFGDKISVEEHVQTESYVYKVPNFILQPLVENAVLHGLEPKIGKGILKIEVQKKENALFFTIEDDGVGMSETEVKILLKQCKENDTRQSIGIKNVYRRLLLCYGEGSLLHIESKKNRGTKITFSIPVKGY